MMEDVLTFLQGNPTFSLFLIIAAGFIVGNIKIKGFSFDVSAVIFVALLFGHFGVQVPSIVQSIGLVIFIFTVGIQAGPGFVDAFRKKGRKYVTFAALLVLSALVAAIVLMYIFGIHSDMIAGIITGSLTSTPGLSVAIETTNSPNASIGYGVAYPFGVIGVVLFVKLLPKLLRIDVNEAFRQFKSADDARTEEVITRDFIVENETICGKTLRDIDLRRMTGCTVSRIQKGEEVETASPDTRLEAGDVVRAVGTQHDLEQMELVIGSHTEKPMPLKSDFIIQTVLVTNKSIVNQPISKIQVRNGCNAVVTRIRRAGIDFTAQPSTTLKFGDKLTIGCRKEDFEKIAHTLGNNSRALSDTDFLPVALGITLGILVGKVVLAFGNALEMNLGITGGVLITALVLSNIGRTGPIVWTMSSAANNLLRQLGLLFFLAGVGTSAGQNLVSTITQSGVTLILVGAIITLVPLVVSIFLNRWFFKLSIFKLFGVLTGGMTSTPGLAACSSMAQDETPSMVYATVYPIAMVSLLIAVKILASLPM